MEEQDNELVQTVETLTKENDELRTKLKEFEEKQALAEKEAEIQRRVQEELAKIKEKEPVKKGVEKLEPKGVVTEKKEVKEAVEEQFIFEGNDLTMSDKYWAEFDKDVRSLSWMKDVKWIPNFSGEVTM